MTLNTGQQYDVQELEFSGWTIGDGSGHEGYHVKDYFDASGFYLGPDKHQIEPQFQAGAPLDADGLAVSP